MSTQLNPLDDEDDSCAIEAGVYHVAVAPGANLELQARIARAVQHLPRPISETAFYGAALTAEDDLYGVGEAWPEGATELFIATAQRMWSVVDGVQRSLRIVS